MNNARVIADLESTIKELKMKEETLQAMLAKLRIDN